MAQALTLYTDFVCPFCFIAEEATVRRLLKEYDLTLDWKGYELSPDTPPGGRNLREKFGPRIGAMHENLRGFAKSFGVEGMKLTEHSPNSRKALAAAEYARDQGKLDAFRDAAMDAHWRKGLDLESDAVLRQLAVETGLDGDGVVAASKDPALLGRIDARRAEAESRGVTGIPTFVIGNQGVVGCQPYEVLAEFVEQAGVKKRA